jgi:hypothetical protein|tara:strand:- start:484 stop:639 length:156 start_codon:yes stop_codon:yes gene_type:complete
MKHYNKYKKFKTPRSELTRLKDMLKRAKDPVEKENILQHIEHWQRQSKNRS